MRSGRDDYFATYKEIKMGLIIAFILILVMTVLENYYRETERFRPNANPKAGTYWHLTQLTALAVTFIYLCWLKYGLQGKLFTSIFLMASVWWIAFDGGLNLLRGLNFFRVSTQSTDPFQKLGKPAIKIIFLVMAVILFILIK